MPKLKYECDWSEWCMATFATLDELAAHEREHWDGALESTGSELTADEDGA